MREITCACLTSLAMTSICAAQTTQPAQNTEPVDSPKTVVRALVKAMSVGDASTMHDLLYAETPTQHRLVAAMTDTAVAIAELNRGMAAKFGDDQAKAVLGDPADAVRMTDANLDKAEEKIEGNTARVSIARATQSTMSLKKVDGKWKVDVAAYINGASPEQVNQTLTGVEHGISVYKQSLAEVNAGKYKTAREAGEALRAKISPGAAQKSQ